MSPEHDTPPAPLLDLRDGIAITGIILMALGFGMVYLPLAFIVPGIILLAIAVKGMP